MDEDETARMYYVLLSDLRLEKRDEAFRALSDDRSEGSRELAKIGKEVFDVIIGQAPADRLEGILSEFDSFPPTSFWSRLMETTGQQLIRACRAIMEMDEDERDQIIEHALRFISRAQDGGFPLSEYTLNQLEDVKSSGSRNAKGAAELISRNQLYAPEKSRVIRPPKKAAPASKQGGTRVKGTAG